MTRLAAAVLAVLAMLGAAYGLGRIQERQAQAARVAAATVAAQSAAAEVTAKLAASEQARRLVQMQLEDQANAQPVAAPACLPVERVRRLNLR